jgi:ATP-dependent helicase/nuclease subunit A
MRAESLPPNGAISASAGTGKTFNLAARYVRLLSCGVDPCRIVALTFSRKAAGEIFDRIVTLMLEWIDDPEKMKQHCLSLGMPPIAPARLTGMLTTVLRSLHLLQIGTIDSFFVRIVRTFPFEFGLAASPEILDEMAVENVRAGVARQVLWDTAAAQDREEFLYEFKQATFGAEEKRLFSHFMRFINDHHTTFLATAGVGLWGDPQTIWPGGNPLLEFDTDPAADVALVRPVVEQYGVERDRQRFLEFLRQAEGFGPASHLSDRYATVNGLFRDNLLGALAELEQGISNIKNYNRKNRLDFDAEQCQALARLVRYLVKCHFLNTMEKSE